MDGTHRIFHDKTKMRQNKMQLYHDADKPIVNNPIVDNEKINAL
jgi:hypothetical protein